MEIRRRGFMGLAAAAGLGAAFLRGVKSWARGLPSDPGSGAKAEGDEIALPAFEKNLGVSLDQAMLSRKSDRSFDGGKTLSMEQVARVLWSANGVNREDGHRTTPSALALYPVDVYAALPDGVFLYALKEHKLVKVSGEDIRDKVPIFQAGLKKAAMMILYVIRADKAVDDKNMLSNLEASEATEQEIAKVVENKTKWADLEIGCMVQNAYLEAAALGLGSCVFALVRFDKVSGYMGLKDNQVLRIAQAVGPLK